MSDNKRPGQILDPNASVPPKVPRLTQPVVGQVRPVTVAPTAAMHPRILNNNAPVQHAASPAPQRPQILNQNVQYASPAPQQQVFGAVGHGQPSWTNNDYSAYSQNMNAPAPAPAPTQIMMVPIPNIGLPAGQYHWCPGAPTYPGQPSTNMVFPVGQQQQQQGVMGRLAEIQLIVEAVQATRRQERQQRVLTGTMERVLTTWSRCTTNERVLFVAYGKIESIKPAPAGQKIFVMGPLFVQSGAQMQVTYFEIDRPLIDLQPEQKVMVSGVMCTDRAMHAFRVDRLTAEEEAALPRVMHVCDRTVAEIARRQ